MADFAKMERSLGKCTCNSFFFTIVLRRSIIISICTMINHFVIVSREAGSDNMPSESKSNGKYN